MAAPPPPTSFHNLYIYVWSSARAAVRRAGLSCFSVSFFIWRDVLIDFSGIMRGVGSRTFACVRSVSRLCVVCLCVGCGASLARARRYRRILAEMERNIIVTVARAKHAHELNGRPDNIDMQGYGRDTRERRAHIHDLSLSRLPSTPLSLSVYKCCGVHLLKRFSRLASSLLSRSRSLRLSFSREKRESWQAPFS